MIRFGTIPRIVRKASLNDELAINNLAPLARSISPIARDRDRPASRCGPGGGTRNFNRKNNGAYLLRQRGWLSLHASGVVINGFGVLFLAASGSGKSPSRPPATRAATSWSPTMSLPSRFRWPLHRLAHSSGHSTRREFRQGRSWKMNPPFHQWDKYLVDVTRGALPDSIEVKRIYVLMDGSDIATEEIPLAASVRILSAHSFFRRRRMDEMSLQSHLRDCVAVAGAASIHQLTRPRLLDALPDVVRFVERDVARQ